MSSSSTSLITIATLQQDHYAILGLERDCTHEDVQLAYEVHVSLRPDITERDSTATWHAVSSLIPRPAFAF